MPTESWLTASSPYNPWTVSTVRIVRVNERADHEPSVLRPDPVPGQRVLAGVVVRLFHIRVLIEDNHRLVAVTDVRFGDGDRLG